MRLSGTNTTRRWSGNATANELTGPVISGPVVFFSMHQMEVEG